MLSGTSSQSSARPPLVCVVFCCVLSFGVQRIVRVLLLSLSVSFFLVFCVLSCALWHFPFPSRNIVPFRVFLVTFSSCFLSVFISVLFDDRVCLYMCLQLHFCVDVCTKSQMSANMFMYVVVLRVCTFNGQFSCFRGTSLRQVVAMLLQLAM